MTRILVIDNYDSFAYNLVQFVGEAVEVQTAGGNDSTAEATVDVYRNDALTIEDIRDIDPDGIVISPGPGTPDDAGVSIPVFSELDYPTLGVCLGHQSLCAALGAPVGHAPEVVHGKPSLIEHDRKGVFADLPPQIEVGRYHSLAVEDADVPDELVVTARTVGTPDGGKIENVVMGVRHREKPHIGVQFHPESILTEGGKTIVQNFVKLASEADSKVVRGQQ
ncbi:anthranilate synthase component II [Haloferax sp. DFSO60]|uniref:anthranilate synthase component II n=1 Tax=Haloferax sp. DFSO60 TaxID=3388652 RepID=UPI00397E7479